jgi:hypothetical protein
LRAGPEHHRRLSGQLHASSDVKPKTPPSGRHDPCSIPSHKLLLLGFLVLVIELRILGYAYRKIGVPPRLYAMPVE